MGRALKKQNWTITCDWFYTVKNAVQPSINLESINGIDITIQILKTYKTKQLASEAMGKILKRLFPEGIEAIDGRL